jgi:hypothetical protein
MLRLIALASTTALLASACAGPTLYQSGADGRYGYDETAIESDRYLVSFSGNSLTERETVETFLLFRAAELTVERGFDHFLVVRRDTESDRRTVTSGDRYYSPFGVRYRYFHPAYGWYGARDPFWNDVQTREITRYEAQAEIVFGRGPAPDDAAAFDARDVIANLGPRVTRPETG